MVRNARLFGVKMYSLPALASEAAVVSKKPCATKLLRRDDSMLLARPAIPLKLAKSSGSLECVLHNEEAAPIPDRSQSSHKWTGGLGLTKSLGHLPNLIHETIAASNWYHSLSVNIRLLFHAE